MCPHADPLLLHDPLATHPSRMLTRQNLTHNRTNPIPLLGPTTTPSHREDATTTPLSAPNRRMTPFLTPPSEAQPPKKASLLQPNAILPALPPEATLVRVGVKLHLAVAVDIATRTCARNLPTGMDRWRLRATLSLPAGRFNCPFCPLLPSLCILLSPDPSSFLLPARLSVPLRRDSLTCLLYTSPSPRD